MRIKLNRLSNKTSLKLVAALAAGTLTFSCNNKESAKAKPEVAAVEKAAAAHSTDKKEASNPAEERKQIAKLFGHDVGKRLRSLLGEEDLDVAIFIESFKGAFSGKAKDLSEAEMEKISMLVRNKMQAKQEKEAAENLKKGQAYLEENKKKDGVTVTKSGLQYKVIKAGKGEKPKKTSKVKVHYEGKLTDEKGTVFDSSYKRGEPVTFPLDRVIKGWTEVLQLMPVGSTWEVTIPSDLAYGTIPRPTIPANSVLVFKIELIGIEKEEKKPAAKPHTHAHGHDHAHGHSHGHKKAAPAAKAKTAPKKEAEKK